MKDGQQGSWFGGASAHDLHTVRRTASELQLSSTNMPSDPRPGSVSPSINFSYPRARLQSPSGSVRSLQTEDHTLVYDPNSRRMVPRWQLQARSPATYEEDDLPREKPKTKKPKQPKQPHLSRAGSHLSRGTVGRTKAPALESSEAEIQLESSPAPEPEVEHTPEVEAAAAPKPKTKKKKKKRTQPLDTAAAAATATDNTADVATASAAAAKLDKSATAENGSLSAPNGKKQTKAAGKVSSATPSPNSKSKVKAVASREPSESPARSARFASSTDQLVVRHEPPPRSLSPRKSALKHASPTRAVSPSDDGSDVSGVPTTLSPNDEARKKSFRVSWDDRNTVVVAEPTVQHAAEQAASSSPQTKKSWHKLVGKGSKKEAVSVDNEETMSPRPELPSFGSVREKKPKEQEERPLVRPEHIAQGDNVAAATPTPAESAIEPNTSKYREPLPTVLPSVEKDEVSSSEDGLMEDTSDEELESDADTNGAAAKKSFKSENDVPEISVSQASPRAQHEATARSVAAPIDVEDDETSSGSEELEMEDAHASNTGLVMDDIKEEEEEEADMYSDAYEEISDGDGNGFLSLDAVLESPTGSPQGKTAKEKSPAQALNELAADPSPEPSAKTSTETPVKSFAGQEDASAGDVTEEGNPPDDWENAKAYWKSLSLEKRRQLEIEAMADEDGFDTLKSGKTEKKTPATKANSQNTTPKKDRSYQIAPGTVQPNFDAIDSTPETTPTTTKSSKANGTTTTSFRKSMRESQHIEAPKSEPRKMGGSLRKSMRTERPVSAGGETLSQRFAEQSSPNSKSRMKQSLRQSSIDLNDSQLRPSLSVTERPASYHAASGSGSSIKHAQSLRVNGSASPVSTMRGGNMKTSLRRRGSDSSESSFTRARGNSAGNHEFRKSMRGSMREPPATADGAKEPNRFSLRPSSPPTLSDVRRNSASSLPPNASFGAGRMRHSLRGAPADPPTRRKMPGFGKSNAGKAKKGKGGSRFDDSSDEEDGSTGLNLFKSRFADSSSEDDEPRPKSRGLPKSLRSKSTPRATSSAIDLPFARNGRDSPSMLDDTTLTQPKRSQAAQETGPESLLPPQTNFGDESGHGSFRPQHARRGSFISLLRRKKDPANRITRDLTESAARQDTSLERSPQELNALRNPSLHKRGPSWPLPEPEDAASSIAQQSERPSTAGGPIVSGTSKSKFLRRRSASHGMVPADTADVTDVDDYVTDAAPQKKKKFGALRKMFRLHD